LVCRKVMSPYVPKIMNWVEQHSDSLPAWLSSGVKKTAQAIRGFDSNNIRMETGFEWDKPRRLGQKLNYYFGADSELNALVAQKRIESSQRKASNGMSLSALLMSKKESYGYKDEIPSDSLSPEAKKRGETEEDVSTRYLLNMSRVAFSTVVSSLIACSLGPSALIAPIVMAPIALYQAKQGKEYSLVGAAIDFCKFISTKPTLKQFKQGMDNFLPMMPHAALTEGEFEKLEKIEDYDERRSKMSGFIVALLDSVIDKETLNALKLESKVNEGVGQPSNQNKPNQKKQKSLSF